MTYEYILPLARESSDTLIVMSRPPRRLSFPAELDEHPTERVPVPGLIQYSVCPYDTPECTATSRLSNQLANRGTLTFAVLQDPTMSNHRMHLSSVTMVS